MSSENSGSSKKGRKSNSQKPKQPQRGLGVAQLEQIRLQSQVDVDHVPSPHSAFHPHIIVDNARPNYMPLSSPSPSSFSMTPTSFAQQSFAMTDRKSKTGDFRGSGYQSDLTDRNVVPQIISTPLTLSPPEQSTLSEMHKKRRQDLNLSIGSSGQNSGSSSDQEELDLELKLSI